VESPAERVDEAVQFLLMNDIETGKKHKESLPIFFENESGDRLIPLKGFFPLR